MLGFGRGKRVPVVVTSAAATWASLSYSKLRQHAQSIMDAKIEATRDRRVQKVLAELG